MSNWFKNRRQRERVPPQKEPGVLDPNHSPDRSHFPDETLNQGESPPKTWTDYPLGRDIQNNIFGTVPSKDSDQKICLGHNDDEGGEI